MEPPAGDPLAHINPSWYEAFCKGLEVVRLDLKGGRDREAFERLLGTSDLLLTSQRPAALARLSLGWDKLHVRLPRLSQVAIVGYPEPNQHLPGHDLTYVAKRGLLTPPHLPRTLIADLGGAERAVTAAVALLLARERGHDNGYAEVALSEAADFFAMPLRYGISAPGAPLGGGLPYYNLYRALEGWIALGALEPRFREKLQEELGLRELTREALEQVFLLRTAAEWEEWSVHRDLPLAAVEEPHKAADASDALPQ